MAEELRKKFGVRCGKTRLYRARRKAQERLEVDHSSSYDKLPKYADILRNKNPSALVKMSYNRVLMGLNPYFTRLFLSLPALKDGF